MAKICAASLARLLLACCVVWVFASEAHSANTHGRPDMMGEMQSWFGDGFTPYVASGCLPAVPSSSLTFGSFACTGYVRGALADLVYVTQPALGLTLANTNGLHWLALHRDTSTSVASWTRRAGSHYLFQQTATQPADPSGGLVVARVTVAGGVITAVSSVANVNPVVSHLVAPAKNVKECGAKVDGVTDDIVALNTCLAIWSHVFVPQGTLLHSGTIVLNVGNWLDGVWQGVDAATQTDAVAIAKALVSGSSLHYTGTGDAVAMLVASPNATECQCKISNLLIYSGNVASQNGIHFENITDFLIDAVVVTGQTYPLTTKGFANAGIYLNMDVGAPLLGVGTVANSRAVYTAGYGIKTGPGNNTNGLRLHDNRIQGNTLGGIHADGQSYGWDIGAGDMEGNGGNQLYAQYASGWNIHGVYSEPPVGNTNDLWRFERGIGLMIAGNRIGGGAALPACLIHLGTNASGFVVQGVSILSNVVTKSGAAVWCLEDVRGIDIRQNTCAATCPTELGGTMALVEGLTYESMTRDIIGGEPVSIVESLPVLVGLDTSNVTFASSVAENTLYTYNVLANTLNLYSGLTFALHGFFGVGAAGPSDFTVKVKYGGVVLSTLRWQAVANAGGNYAFVLEGKVFGSQGFGVAHQACEVRGYLGGVTSQVSTVIDTGSTMRQSSCYAGAAGADMTVDQALVVTVQATVNSANVTAGKESAFVYRLHK